jgi:hypothetical protein
MLFWFLFVSHKNTSLALIGLNVQFLPSFNSMYFYVFICIFSRLLPVLIFPCPHAPPSILRVLLPNFSEKVFISPGSLCMLTQFPTAVRVAVQFFIRISGWNLKVFIQFYNWEISSSSISFVPCIGAKGLHEASPSTSVRCQPLHLPSVRGSTTFHQSGSCVAKFP